MNKKTHFGYREVDQSDKEKHVGDVFTSVAKNYDVMNDAMSFGMHRLWKKILVELAAVDTNDNVLDIASGTGDISKLISKEYPETFILMSDINYDMLDEGRNRAIDENFEKNCHFCQLSGESLPFANETFDLITIGFGLRNFTNKEKGLKEMKRCLKKGGKLMVLEFSKPINPAFSKLYDWYSFNVLPKLGSMLANDSESYQYLAESIRMHPNQELLKTMILEAKFNDCKFYNILNGIVAIHIGYND
ncbi:MAG: bifunctional demethylmenaquinone methyltransferase/2-methoxy-6-polyprenyl-1,4-benzoquinol methylase UbiE [Gammaproteobacteria bacterium]|nr:bifunctional demethylmenaquinone methyltransferase/2-methoxy-6-polyprenyl-1,4-benzoquinol methylase UbiE [Gammaproteobacteria bacterium]|tara:strand:- start:1957 stop:2697 length:741 start_codon:yes stop_codon:yes gene_type:complete